MEQTRLNELKEWISPRIIDKRVWALSEGPYHELHDFRKVMELLRAGLLGNGRKLRSIGFSLNPLETEAVMEAGTMSLCGKNMEVYLDT